jgi:hypothetical protein
VRGRTGKVGREGSQATVGSSEAAARLAPEHGGDGSGGGGSCGLG